MLESLNLLENAVFVKHARAQLRPARLFPWLIIFLTLCGLAFLGPLVVGHYWLSGDPGWQRKAGAISCAILWSLQWLLLTLGATSRVATALGEEKNSGILEFHRVTPTSGFHRVAGYLFGVPISEYLLVIISLPLSFISAWLAEFSIAGIFLGYLIFWINCVFFHCIALNLGLVAKKSKSASGSAVGFVIGLPILALILSRANVQFLSYLTAGAAFHDVGLLEIFGKISEVWPDEAFFGLKLSYVLCTILLHFVAIAFLIVAASRKLWRQESPMFAKWQTLMLLAILAVLLIGGYWQELRDAPMAGERFSSERYASVLGTTLGVLWLGALLFIRVATALPLTFSRAVERAKKAGKNFVNPLVDGASNLVCVVGFLFIILVAYFVVLLATNSAITDVALKKPTPFALAAPFLILAVGTLAWASASEFFSLALRRHKGAFMVLFFFVTWVVPVLVPSILATADVVTWRYAGYGMVVCPPVGVSWALARFTLVKPSEYDLALTITTISLSVNFALLVLFFLLAWAKRKLVWTGEVK